ncbi:hypothetical protein [Streptomyces sp. NPDC002403]
MLEPEDEEPADPEPMAAVVTVGSDRCYVVANVADHPIQDGSAAVITPGMAEIIHPARSRRSGLRVGLRAGD